MNVNIGYSCKQQGIKKLNNIEGFVFELGSQRECMTVELTHFKGLILLILILLIP